MGQPQAWANGRGNLLLATLPKSELEIVSPHLESVLLEATATIYDPDAVISHVYFPETGIVSLLGVLADGTGVETAIVGREGMVGLPVFHRTDRIAEQAVVQLQGTALRMSVASLRECLEKSPALQDALHHYTACVFMFAAQSVACMNKHRTPRRLARWLLHAADHSGTEGLELTQLFLSHMLGVRRSSVTVAASALRAKGLITYTRRRIEITNREGLAEYSCECYGIVRSTYDRIMFGTASVNPLVAVKSSRSGHSILRSPHGDKGAGD